MFGVFQVGGHEIHQAAGITHGGEEAGGEGVALQVGDAGEQDDGDFTMLGDIGQGIEIALDFGAGGIVGGGEEQVGVVDQDQADGFVLMEQFGESIQIVEGEWGITAAGLLAIDLGEFTMDLGENQDLIGIDAQGLKARFQDIVLVAVGDQEDGGTALRACLVGDDDRVGERAVGVGGGVEGLAGGDAGLGGKGGSEMAGELGEARAGGSGDKGETVAGEEVVEGPEWREVGEFGDGVEIELDERQKSGLNEHGNPLCK